MKFRWSLAAAQPLLAGQLAKQLHIPALLAQCLLNRKLGDPLSIAGFLQPRLKDLVDPFLLPNMKAAIERLFAAHQHREPLVIFGDYDVDGVTATALLVEVLQGLGWSVSYYLPRRLDEGYGLSQEAVENCLKKFPVKLLLAVDCGSANPGPIAWLGARGVDVIVLDHHQVSTPAPAALALVNPQLQPRSGLPTAIEADRLAVTEFCSAGLAFKLAHALVKHGRVAGLAGAATFDLRPLLDLVALGTIADLVPLTGENRTLASAGLERLNSTRRPGLVALKKVAQCPAPIGVCETGFQLAPRLNAAGRLEDAEQALQLLLASGLEAAMPLAQALDGRNRERQTIERRITQEALAAVQARLDVNHDFVIVEANPSWHIGVVGIVASRLLQQFHRPTIIAGGQGNEYRGSGRSIAGFDLAAALRECGDLLVRHGGHAMSAGLTVLPGKIDLLRARLNELVREALPPEAFQPTLQLDATVGLGEMNLECLAHLGHLKPMGCGNPGFQFMTRNVRHQRPAQRLGPDRQHLKMWVTDGTASCEALWWGAGSAAPPKDPFDLAFVPQINEYNGRRCVQLKVLDWSEGNV